MNTMQDELTALIAKDLGINDLPVDKQSELIAQFGEVALKAATASIFDHLAKEKHDEFIKLAEAGNPEALKAFLDREVPTHEEIAKQAVADEVKRFKEFENA